MPALEELDTDTTTAAASPSVPTPAPSVNHLPVSPTGVHYPVDTEYRDYLLSYPSTSPVRLLTLSSHQYRLIATPPHGDCGYYALSFFLNPSPPPAQLRRTLATHILSEASFYKKQLDLAALGTSQTNHSVRNFADNVRRGGMRGHWMGSLWGEVELLAIARCFDITLILYTFDVKTQTVRQYYEVGEGKVARLMFWGSADAGHFDALLPLHLYKVDQQLSSKQRHRTTSFHKPFLFHRADSKSVRRKRPFISCFAPTSTQ